MKLLILMVFAGLILTACAAAPGDNLATEPSYPGPEPIEMITPEPYPYPYPEPEPEMHPTTAPLADSALLPLRQNLADLLGLKVDEVTLLKQEEMMWSDGCLGLAQPGEMCTQAIVPGYLVVLATPKGEFEYHTDRSLRSFRLATPSAQIEGSEGSTDVLVTWQRTGGFAGICEELTIYMNGDFTLKDCRKSESLAKGKLPPEDWEVIQSKAASIYPHDWKFTPPPGSADMFLDSYSWHGTGSKSLDSLSQEELNTYLAELAARLKAQPPQSSVTR